MKPLRSLCAVLLLLIASNVFAADPTLPELFKRAKDEFAAGSYQRSLTDFELLDSTSAQPGFENDRAKLIPVVTFYRGANLAALGRKADAKEAFITYLTYTPGAAIASPLFPKATVDLFEQARKEAAGRSNTVGTAYAAFSKPAGWSLPADEHWIESPAKYLLTPAQKKEYATFTTNAERASFVEAFWKQLDPTPPTEVNELRNEFERRLAFADANLATPRQAGHLTDRAAVFAFLGPPTYAGIKSLASANTLDEARATSVVPIGGRDLERQGSHGQSETWYYRPGRLPAGVPFPEVHFDFITKEGYGTSVMQKDSAPMQTLGIAADAARRDKKLN
jgi:GWxTD domain-containing protein